MLSDGKRRRQEGAENKRSEAVRGRYAVGLKPELKVVLHVSRADKKNVRHLWSCGARRARQPVAPALPPGQVQLNCAQVLILSPCLAPNSVTSGLLPAAVNSLSGLLVVL